MPGKLIVIEGPDEGQIFPIADESTVMIGRGADAQIRLADSHVSRAHCSIQISNGHAILKDNNSKGGTRVDHKTITEHNLEADSVIHIGHTRLSFQTTAPPLPRPNLVEKPGPSEETIAEHEELKKLSGTRLKHFDIGSVVGVGTSGVVFTARDTNDDRDVALKVYTPEFAEKEEDLNRFIRAVKTMLPMRHRNLVTLYGGGKTGPYCWMSMEYVEGENLKETIDRIGKKGKLDWRPALRMASDLARGLHYIHSENIIHRNLSPGNILFSRLGEVKLGSLILAKALSGALAKDVTVGGNFLGEVRYLAPEQVGAGGPVDGRADIYSLGTLFYALLSGRVPFEGRTAIETATWILQREPTSPRKYDPLLPEALEKIVLKMLAKSPDERYQTAGELMNVLEQLPKF
jgi:serine/threonine protein kinase